MSDPIFLGARLRYPITISRLVAKPGDEVKKGATVMEYSFKWTKEVGDPISGDTWEEEQTTISSWGSPVEGKLKEWKIKPGDVVPRDQPCLVVEEACQHPVQISGLCAICGKDMTEVNWVTTRVETERAPINMTHDQVGLTVSRQQAMKVELDLQRRLLEQRKLSLVVDLDQTIIHACIDPTVGEWQKDPSNPNYEAVKDVQSFQLNDDGPRGVASGCFYYIKMRPGLREFLEHISQMYELHVYTMGTRAYAANIAKIVDPDQKLFGNRVISRDENGSMTAKSLQRLFPVSTNMVVIIDDRADVWPKNRPNLIKVVPYDFFRGVGDINSSFLPKREDQLPADKPAPVAQPAVVNGTGEAAKVSALEGLAGMSSGEDAALLKLQTEEQERELEKQLQDRPLLHMQEQRDKEDEEAEKAGQENLVPEGEGEGETTPSHQRHQILFDDDEELKYLEQHLTTLHSKYYELQESNSNTEEIPDVGEVLDELKSEVLRGTKIVLSGLVPLGIDVFRSEIGQQVLSFGADLRTRIDPDVTHLVISSSRPRTQKVRQAARIPTIKIVNQNWLQDSISQWEELDEEPYIVDVHPADRGTRIAIPALPTAEEQEQQLKNGGVLPAEEDLVDDSADDDEDEEGLEIGAGGGNVMRSPIDDLKTFDFEEVDQELAEFLADGSDDSDEEDNDDNETEDGDKESSKSDDTGSERGGVGGGGDKSTSPGSKRRHGEGVVDTDDESSTASGNPSLNKKLKTSRSRGASGLQSELAANGTATNGGGGDDDGDEEVLLLNTSGGDEELEFDADNLEADLMAELDREEAEDAALADKG